jgi:ferredoxin-thioredoxin reductase catalytic subunit
MTNDINIEHFIHLFEIYAKSKGWELSKYADKIISRSVNLCEGKCPCSPERGFCPCSEHEKEIESDGICHCTLFQKKQE